MTRAMFRFLPWLPALPLPVSTSCLTTIVPPTERKNIMIDGTEMSLGIWALGWESAVVYAHMFKILAEERLGYNVRFYIDWSGIVESGLWAIAGCEEGGEGETPAPGCVLEVGEAVSRFHLNFETFAHYLTSAITRLEEHFPARRPTNLGEVGYSATEGTFFRSSTLLRAISEEGMGLDSYRFYNASWYDPGKYFDTLDYVDAVIANITTTGAYSCSTMPVLTDHPQMSHYAEYFGDWNGTQSVDGDIHGKCWGSDHWWASPACRDDLSRCVPWVTFSSWGLQGILHKATHHNMPVAITSFPNFHDWVSVVRETNVCTYWWVPDLSFIGLDMAQLLFTPYDETEQDSGILITAFDLVSLEKWAHPELENEAIEVWKSALAMDVNFAQMLGVLTSINDGLTSEEAACQFLREHEELYESWIPQDDECALGQGLHSGVCDWCEQATFSAEHPENNNSRLCMPCEGGQFQQFLGETACSVCEAGLYSTEGSDSCTYCAKGTYQPQSGSTACEPCGAHETTENIASTNIAHCICSVGFYPSDGQCVPCPSRSTTLDSGSLDVMACLCQEETYMNIARTACLDCPVGMRCAEGNDPPLLAAGYWADASDDHTRHYSVFRCRDVHQCPGDIPAGGCASNREGVGCASCVTGTVPRSNSGSCERCDGTSWLPMLLAVGLCCAGLVSLCLYTLVDVTKANVNTVAVGICLGQMVIAVQSMSVLGNLEVEWVEPVLSLTKVIAVIGFKLEVLNISCAMPDSNVISLFLGKMMIFPFLSLVLGCLLFCMKRFLKLKVTVDSGINSLGLLYMVLFMTLSVVALEPFQCLDSPNETSSMSSNPSVLCDGNATFVSLAIVGVLGLIVYCVFLFAMLVYVTLQYPVWIASGQGAMVMRRYRFVFQRFSVECYYFAPFYLMRNFLLALLPVIFANHGHRQIFGFSIVLLAFGFLQAMLQPWRGRLPNYLDALVTACLVLSLIGACLLLPRSKGTQTLMQLDMQFVLCGLVILSMGAFSVIMVMHFWKRFLPTAPYIAFLSHHKGGCAAGARLLKMDLERFTGGKIFLDSDNLDNLEFLLHMVRSSSQSVVVLLTRETLRRPWCAGELATAQQNSVPMICVAYDDYQDPEDEELTVQGLKNVWSAENFAQVALQGVTLEHVLEAYLKIKGAEKMEMRRVARVMDGGDAFETASENLVQRVGRFCVSGSLVHKWRSLDRHVVKGCVEVFVLANCIDGEAISRALILTQLLQKVTQKVVSRLFHQSEVRNMVSEAHPNFLVVSLTSDALASDIFVSTLLAVMTVWRRAHVLVVKSSDFKFPTKEFLDTSVCPQLAKKMDEEEEKLRDLFSFLLSEVALPFSPESHSLLLDAEVDRLSQRMLKYKGGPKLPSKSSSALSAPPAGEDTKLEEETVDPKIWETPNEDLNAPVEQETNMGFMDNPPETREREVDVVI